MGTRSAKCWNTERFLSKNGQAGKTVVSRRSLFESWKMSDGTGSNTAVVTSFTPVLFDLNSPAFVVALPGT